MLSAFGGPALQMPDMRIIFFNKKFEAFELI